MNTATQSKITQANLEQFYGTEGYFFNPLWPNYMYTDGCKWLSDNGAAWLITDCLGYAQQFSKRHDFIAFKLTVANEEGTLSVEDGNGNVLKSVALTYTDFPLPSVLLYFTNNVLMLSGEY